MSVSLDKNLEYTLWTDGKETYVTMSQTTDGYREELGWAPEGVWFEPGVDSRWTSLDDGVAFIQVYMRP